MEVIKLAKYSEVIYQKTFSGKNMKDAYLKACKWYASNVLSKDELRDVSVEYIKDKQYPTVTARLFVSIEEPDVKAEHCKICKETHKAFFINENTNCSWCNCDAYHRRLDRMLKTKSAYFRSKIERGEIW